MNCQECRNAILLEVVRIRRSCQRILDARGDQDGDRVAPAVLNINHGLNEMERHIEKCRAAERDNGNASGTDKAARRIAVDSIP